MSIPAVDLHCHLDLYPDPSALVRMCKEAGAYVLSVTTTPRAWRKTMQLAQGCPRIKTGLGLHPQIAHQRINELDLFNVLLPETRYIGEVGLDGGSELKQHWKTQVLAFEHILAALQSHGGRIISIHSRKATTEVLDRLDRFPSAGIPVLHWFSGSKAELMRAIEMGCWFSVGPGMLSGKRGAELLSLMPRNRVITETDGPFVKHKGKVLMPAEVDLAQAFLGKIWGVDQLEAARTVLNNFRSLVSQKVGGPEH